MTSGFHLDTGVPIHEQPLEPLPEFPEPRCDREVLISIAQLLEELLAEVKRGNSTAREGAVSSLQIEDNPTKDRIVRLTSKIYAGSELPVEDAIQAHGHAHRLAEQHALDGWAETVEELQNGGAP